MNFLVRRVGCGKRRSSWFRGWENKPRYDVLYLGFEKNDEIIDLEWGNKENNWFAIFDDSEGKMNLPVNEKMRHSNNQCQFTLFGNSKGYRPSFNRDGCLRIWHAFFMINSSRF